MTEIKDLITPRTVVVSIPTKIMRAGGIKDLHPVDSDRKVALRAIDYCKSAGLSLESVYNSLTQSIEQYPGEVLEVNAPFVERKGLIGETYVDQEKIVAWQKVRNPVAGYLNVPEGERNIQLEIRSTAVSLLQDQQDSIEMIAVESEKANPVLEQANQVAADAEAELERNKWILPDPQKV